MSAGKITSSVRSGTRRGEPCGGAARPSEPVRNPRNGRYLGASPAALLASLVLAASIALGVLGFGASSAWAQDDQTVEPIVGLWLVTVSYNHFVFDNVFSGWTSDGLEYDQHSGAPILIGYVCYGHWIKLKGHNTYALTHPFFNYNPGTSIWDSATAGLWNGTSGYLNWVVTVSDDGKTFTGKENSLNGVTGPNPYTGTGGTPFSGVTLSATKIEVDKTLLP
jgi:hypothetical protein